MADIEFFLYSRESCHLCHEFKRRLDSLLSGFGHRCRVVSIDGDAELTHRYGARLPVLVAGGREICEAVFDEAMIRSYIKEQEDLPA
jgi:hypothetical protein